MSAIGKIDDTKRFLIQGVLIGLITHLGLGLFFSIERKTYTRRDTASTPVILIPLNGKNMKLKQNAADWVNYNNPTMLAKSTMALDFGGELSPHIQHDLKHTQVPFLHLKKTTRFEIKHDSPVTANLEKSIPLRNVSINTIITEPTFLDQQFIEKNKLIQYPYLLTISGEVLKWNPSIPKKIKHLKPKQPTELVVTIGHKSSLPRIVVKRSSGIVSLDQWAVYSLSEYLRKHPFGKKTLYVQMVWRSFL